MTIVTQSALRMVPATLCGRNSKLREIIRQLCKWKKVEILEGNVQIDHIHLVLSFLKGKSAIKMFETYIDLKKQYWGRHFWAKGYCVSAVGLDEDRIRKYVRWQLKRDKGMDQLKLWE